MPRSYSHASILDSHALVQSVSCIPPASTPRGFLFPPHLLAQTPPPPSVFQVTSTALGWTLPLDHGKKQGFRISLISLVSAGDSGLPTRRPTMLDPSLLPAGSQENQNQKPSAELRTETPRVAAPLAALHPLSSCQARTPPRHGSTPAACASLCHEHVPWFAMRVSTRLQCVYVVLSTRRIHRVRCFYGAFFCCCATESSCKELQEDQEAPAAPRNPSLTGLLFPQAAVRTVELVDYRLRNDMVRLNLECLASSQLLLVTAACSHLKDSGVTRYRDQDDMAGESGRIDHSVSVTTSCWPSVPSFSLKNSRIEPYCWTPLLAL